MVATKEESREKREARRDGAAKGRDSRKLIRWPDAKFEVAGAKCALRNDRSPAQSFARSLTHSLASEKRDAASMVAGDAGWSHSLTTMRRRFF